MSEEYVKGARYRVTFEGEWDGERIHDEGLRVDRSALRYLTKNGSVEKIADPTPEWLPGDKVLRDGGDNIAIYKDTDRWSVYYPTGGPTVLSTHGVFNYADDTEVLVKQGKRVPS